MKKIFQIAVVLLLLTLMAGCASFKAGMYNYAISGARSKAGLNPGFVNIDGQTLAYLERPGSGETIVLIHGFGANKDNWIRFVRYLPPEYRVIAFDMSGHGDSSKLNDKTYSIDFMTSSFAQAANALGLSKFHIAGSSMGGKIALLYTAQNPQRVVSMCLLDTGGLSAVSPQPSDLQLAVAKGQSPLTPTSKKEFSELMKYAFYKEPFIPWPITSVMAEKAVEASAFNQKIWRDINAHPTDIVPLLPGLQLPVLVIWGDKDRILHVSTTEVLKRSLPDAETIIMKDCGHVPMLERPQETAEYYAAFLNRHKKPLQSP